MFENIRTLLTLCARVQGHPTQYQTLQQQADKITNWDMLPTQAENHNLTPLVYLHLQAANVSLPKPVKDQLQLRTIQHSHANQIRAKTLIEITECFRSAGIETLVLKGAALAHLDKAYPKPGLRAMRDIDLLVSQSQARQAQSLLAQLGFNAPMPGHDLPIKHLAIAQRDVEGLPISVEIHHNLYAHGTAVTELEALRPNALPFTLEGATLYTLSYEDMLEHIYGHAVNMFNPLRLISLVDLVSLAEGYAPQINWSQVSDRVCNGLSVFHWLTPLSDELLKTAPIKIGHKPKGVGQEFQGWPRYALAAQGNKGYPQIMYDSFFPTEWWLRFYYNLPSGPAVWWGRFGRHPLHILHWVGHYFVTKVIKV